MNYGPRFMILYRRQGSRPFPRKKKCKRQNGCLRRSYKAEKRREVKDRKKGKIY